LAHGELTPEEAGRARDHLAACRRCREADAEIRAGVELASRLAVVRAPETIWAVVEAAIGRRKRAISPWPRRTAPAAGAAVLLVAAGVAVLLLVQPARRAWSVAGAGRLAVGQWIETDAASRLELTAPGVGRVEVEPATRLRIVRSRPTESRLALARGAIAATIVAPPRLFLVETASALPVHQPC